jgi:molybdopterin-binding protein
VIVIKLSARDKLKGVEVRKRATITHVKIKAADELRLAAGQIAHAVIKASDVMVGPD